MSSPGDDIRGMGTRCGTGRASWGLIAKMRCAYVMKEGGVILRGKKMRRLINSPSTFSPSRARHIRYNVKRSFDGAVHDIILMMEGSDERVAAYVAERVRSDLAARVGGTATDDWRPENPGETAFKDKTMVDLEDEMWGTG